MANFNFVGDLTNVRKSHLDFISKALEKRGYKGSKVVFEAVGIVGDNYMANVKRIVVQENGETFKMIAKLAPENPLVRQMSMIENFFRNEEFAYTELFPKFQQKLKMAGVPESEGIRFPKCYGVSTEAPDEVILLEDLKESGFYTQSRFEPTTDESMKMILRFLAVYHSLSYVLRYQDPETFAAFQKKLEYIMQPPQISSTETESSERKNMYFQAIENQCLKMLENDKHKKFMKGAVSNFISFESKINKMIKTSKYSVIQHGDAWITNVMFRSENEIPVECLMVDYQMIKENCPVYDVMYIIFNSTTRKQRSANFYDYFDYYHGELDKSLSNFGLKANLVYPKDRLDADLKIYGKFAFAANVISASISTKNTDEAAKMREVMELREVVDPEKTLNLVLGRNDDASLNKFRSRVEDLLESYCEFGLI